MSVYDGGVLEATHRLLDIWVDYRAGNCAGEMAICTNSAFLHEGLSGRLRSYLAPRSSTLVDEATRYIGAFPPGSAELYVYRRDVVRRLKKGLSGEYIGIHVEETAPAESLFADLAVGERPFIMIAPMLSIRGSVDTRRWRVYK